MAPDQKKYINHTNGFDCTIKKREEVGQKVRNVEVNVGKMTSQSGCEVMVCVFHHASIGNIVTGRQLFLD